MTGVESARDVGGKFSKFFSFPPAAVFGIGVALHVVWQMRARLRFPFIYRQVDVYDRKVMFRELDLCQNAGYGGGISAVDGKSFRSRFVTTHDLEFLRILECN